MVGISVLSSVVVLAVAICQVAGRPDMPPGQQLAHRFLTGEVSEDKIDKCCTETGLSKDELEEMKAKSEKPGEREMCFAKCLATTAGSIKANGDLNIEFLKNHIPPVFEKEAATITSCLEKVRTISTCQDISKIFMCLPKPPMESK